MLYNLRVCIHPDSWEQQIEDLVWTCNYAGIDEVLLCEQPYRLAPILQPLSYHRKMKNVYAEILPLLQQEGIRTSMYIKASVGHGCNCSIDPQIPFRKFVGSSLVPSTYVPCLLDPQWQDYLAQVFGEYAKLGFAKIFIDDDFRSINSDGGQIGCFCPLHAQKVSQRLGTTIDSEALLASVLGNDEESLKVRKAWLDENYRGQFEAITKFAQAIHQESPETLFGLMNSGVEADALQGRKIRELLQAAAGGNRPLSRPPGGAYQDTYKEGIVGMQIRTAKAMALQGKDVYYLSEVENFPRNIFCKSKTILDLQMSIHAFLGVSELSLNIFDHYQTPSKYSREYLDLLKEKKEKYIGFKQLTEGKELLGVGFPWHEEICYHLQNRSGSAGEIGFRHQLDSSFLGMGLPVQYTVGKLNCLEGDLVLCYSDQELLEFLQGGLLIDRIAAKNLCDRGFSEFLGASFQEQYRAPCYESFANEDFNPAYLDQYTPIFNGKDGAASAYLFSPAADAIAASWLLDLDKKRIAPGTILYENKLGGRVCTFAAPALVGDNWNIKCRQEQLQRIISWLGKSNFPLLLENGVNVAPFLYYGNRQWVLVLVNTGFDLQTVEFAGSLAPALPERVELAPFELKYFLGEGKPWVGL